VFFKTPHLYLFHSQRGSKNVSIVSLKNTFYYATLHTRFSTVFYSSQLVDLFAYELPLNNRSESQMLDSQLVEAARTFNSVVVYNFHNLTFQERFFFFCVESSIDSTSHALSSIAELYPNANWLEREASELHGLTFLNKKDLRNLMLQYGDVTAPFVKSAPSIGLTEFHYDSINDTLAQTIVTTQL
jgi:NADH:ubiquinone oxidoreductase subunit C